jgi:hypothetical protein
MITNRFIDADVRYRAAIAAIILRLENGETDLYSDNAINTFTSDEQSRKLRAAIALRIVKVLYGGDTLSAIVCNLPRIGEYERRTAIAVVGGDFLQGWERFTKIEQLEEWEPILTEYAQDHAPGQEITEELVERLKKYGEHYA